MPSQTTDPRHSQLFHLWLVVSGGPYARLRNSAPSMVLTAKAEKKEGRVRPCYGTVCDSDTKSYVPWKVYLHVEGCRSLQSRNPRKFWDLVRPL